MAKPPVVFLVRDPPGAGALGMVPRSGFTLVSHALVATMAAQMPVRALARIVNEHDMRLWRIVKMRLWRVVKHSRLSQS